MSVSIYPGKQHRKVGDTLLLLINEINRRRWEISGELVSWKHKVSVELSKVLNTTNMWLFTVTAKPDTTPLSTPISQCCVPTQLKIHIFLFHLLFRDTLLQFFLIWPWFQRQNIHWFPIWCANRSDDQGLSIDCLKIQFVLLSLHCNVW